MEYPFKTSRKLKILFYTVHLLMLSPVLLIPLVTRTFFHLSWMYAFLFFLGYLYAGGIVIIAKFILFFRATNKFKEMSFITVEHDGISSKTKKISWDSINGLIFESAIGAGIIATQSIERLLGYFVLKTSSGDYPIPSTIENLDNLLKIIVEKTKLKKTAPTIQGSIMHSFTIFQRHRGDFYCWEKQTDYSPIPDDFIFKASYTKGFFGLFFVMLFGVMLVFLIAYLASKFNLI